jgi:hypothetical protein
MPGGFLSLQFLLNAPSLPCRASAFAKAVLRRCSVCLGSDLSMGQVMNLQSVPLPLNSVDRRVVSFLCLDGPVGLE